MLADALDLVARALRARLVDATGVAFGTASNPITTKAGAVAAASTYTETSVAANVASVILVAADAARLGLKIRNDGTANLMVSFTGAATTSSPIRLASQVQLYLGPQDPEVTLQAQGIWDVANGNARVGVTK